MLGVQPTVADPAGLVEEPRTARDAARAVETVLEHHLDTALGRARDVDPLFARDVAARVSAFVQRGGKRLRTAFAWCGWRTTDGSGDATAVPHTGAALELLQACAPSYMTALWTDRRCVGVRRLCTPASPACTGRHG